MFLAMTGAERGVGSGAIRSCYQAVAANALGGGHAKQGDFMFPSSFLRLGPA